MMKRSAQSLSYVGPIAARHSIMLHLMQDLLHWAHKLALYGLLELGCVYNFDYMKKLLQILRENRLEKASLKSILLENSVFPQVQSLAGSLFDKYNAFQEVQKTIVKATGIKNIGEMLG